MASYLNTYKQAIERLKTGGMALEADLQAIEEQKKQTVASGEQALVSSGLSGTTMMAGVGTQAEKIAGIQRLGAKGAAETRYLSALTSFTALAQSSREAQLNREASLQQAGIAALPGILQAKNVARAQQPTGLYNDGVSSGGTSAGGGNYSDQFPSLYGQGGELPDAPSLFDGGGGAGGMGGTGGTGGAWGLQESGGYGTAEGGYDYTPQFSQQDLDELAKWDFSGPVPTYEGKQVLGVQTDEIRRKKAAATAAGYI